MTSSERKVIASAIAHVIAGDRRSALAILRPLRVAPVRVHVQADQLVLRFVLDERFHCPRLDAAFRVRECLERRGARWPSGDRKGKPKSHQCVGCPTGEAFAFSLPGVRLRPATQPPEVLPHMQRMAKRARALCELPHDDHMDVLYEAASLTPDDKREWEG